MSQPNNSIPRRDIMRNILRKYHGTGRYSYITEHLANKIISRIFELKVENLYKKGYVRIGHGFGDIIIMEFEHKAEELTDFGIDWKRTKELWETNPKAKEEHKVVRDLTVTRPVRFKWTNKPANTKNLYYYTFKANRQLRRKTYADKLKNKPIMFLQ